jgi:hypothetical protein
MTDYRDVVIETFENPGEPAAERIRARPLPGQGLDTSMRVSCSSKMRDSLGEGAIVLLRAKVTDRQGGTPFLYSPPSSPYKVLSAKEARAFIKKQYQKMGAN